MRVAINVNGHDKIVEFDGTPTDADIEEAAVALGDRRGSRAPAPPRVPGTIGGGEIRPAVPNLAGLNLPVNAPARPTLTPAQINAAIQGSGHTALPPQQPAPPPVTTRPFQGRQTSKGLNTPITKQPPTGGGTLSRVFQAAAGPAGQTAARHVSPQYNKALNAAMQHDDSHTGGGELGAPNSDVKRDPRYGKTSVKDARQFINDQQESIANWIRNTPILNLVGNALEGNSFPGVHPVEQIANILNTPTRVNVNAGIVGGEMSGATAADKWWSGGDLTLDLLPLAGGAELKAIEPVVGALKAAYPEVQGVDGFVRMLTQGRNAQKAHAIMEGALKEGINPEAFKAAFGNSPVVNDFVEKTVSNLKPTVTNPIKGKPSLSGLTTGEDSFASPAKTVPFKPVEPAVTAAKTGLVDQSGNVAGHGVKPPELILPETSPVKPIEPVEAPKVEPKPTRTRAPKVAVIEEEAAAEVKPAPGTDTGNRVRLSSVKHADTRAMETELGIPAKDPQGKVSIGQALTSAYKAGIIDDAHNIAASIVKKPRPLTYEETVGLGARGQQLAAERGKLMDDLAEAIKSGDTDKAEVLRSKVDENRNHIYNISQALDQGGTEAGRAFGARKSLLKDDYSAFGLTKRAIVKKGAQLSPEQQAIFDNHAKTIDKLTAEVDRLKGAASRQKAETAMQGVAKNPPRPAQRNYRFTEERLAASRKNLAALHSNPVLPIAEHLYNVAGYHIERGVYKVADLIANIKAEGKDLGYEVSDVDAADAIERAAKTVSNIANKGRGFGEDIQIVGGAGIQSSEISRARQELDALKGELSKAANSPDKGLLKDLSDQVNALDRAQKGGNLEAQRKLVESINKTRRQLNQGAALGENVLQSGKAAIEHPQVKELRERIEMHKIQADRDLAKVQAEAEWDAMSKWQRSGVWAKDLANLPKGLKASFDASAPLRQGVFYAITKPKLWAKSVEGMLKAMAKEDFALRIEGQIHSSPHYELGQRSGLFLADQAAPLNAHEEAFMSSKIGKYIPGYKAAERGYVTFLNKLRQDAFDSMVEGFTSKGKPVSKELAADIARMVNQNTGRGTGRVADALSSFSKVGFAPRYTYSRFQMLKPLAGATTTEGKQLALQEYGKFMAAVGTAAGLLKLSGANIELDPRSSQFLKVKVGHTYIDLFGGAQMPIKVAASLGGSKNLQTGAIQPRTLNDTIGNFIGNKLDPGVSVLAHLAQGKDFIGNDYNLRTLPNAGKVLNDLMGPISVGQTYENFQNQPAGTAAALSVGSLFGADTSTINPKSDALGRPYVNGADDDVVSKELARVGVARALPDKRPGESQDEQNARAKAQGDFMHAYLDKFIQRPEYTRATPVEKKLYLDRATSLLSKQFNAAYSQRMAEQKKADRAAQINEQRKTGIR